MPDIFDQASAPAPQGDIFDHATGQLSAKPVAAPGNDAAYLKAHPGMDPLAVEQAFQQLQGQAAIPQATSAQQFAQATAGNEGFLTNAGKSLGQTVANPVQGMVGLMAPQAGMQLRENNALTYANQGAGGFVGQQAGNLVNTPYTVTPIGRMLSAAGAMGNKRIDIAQERAAGNDVSGAGELARVAAGGALDYGGNLIANKLGGKFFGGLGKGAVSDTAKAIVTNVAKRFGADAVTNEVLSHAQIAAQNVIDGRPITEGMGKESLAAPLIQTAAMGVVHGGSDFLHGMRQRASGAAAPVAEQVARGTNPAPEQLHQGPAENAEAKPAGPVNNQGIDQKQLEVAHTPENRQNPVTPEDHLMAALDRKAEEGYQPEAPKPAEQRLYEKLEAQPQTSVPQEQKQAAEEHPTRLDDEKALTDWYKKTNPNDQTGDLIGTMAPHVPYALADVPHEFAKPMSTGEDVDRNKIEGLKALSDEDHAKLPPLILGPEGEVFDGNHRAIAAQEAGRNLRAYVPESLIGQHGITAAGAGGEPKAGTNVPESGTTLSKFMAGKPESLPQGTPRLSGGRRAGAIALPSHADVYGPGSIYHEEVRPQLQKVANAAHELKEGLKSMFPVETGAGDKEAQQTFREQFNRNANAYAAAEDRFESIRQAFDKATPDVRQEFMRNMYDEQKQPTPELQKIADAMHEDTNEGRKTLMDLGHEAAEDWSKTWYNMLWKKDAAKAAELRAISGNPNRPGKIEGKGSFLKGRSLGGFDEGLAQGLVPKYENPVEMFLATKAERGKYIAGVKGMEQLVRNEQIVRAETDEDGRAVVPQGWSEVPSSVKGPLTKVLANKYEDQLKGETPLIAPEGVNRILKNITTPSALGNKAAFRLLMDANNTMTQSMLGLSAFHIKKVSQELVNMSAARSLDLAMAGDQEAAKTALQSVISPFKAAMNGGDIQKMMLGSMKPQTADQARVIDAMKSQFKARPDKEYETQWGRKFQKALDQGGLQGMIRAGIHAAPALNERLMQKGVFGFVQRAKLHMGSELVTDYLRKNPNATHDQLVAETGKISDHLDNVLGLMNRDNLFWNRTARDLATLGTLSVGWNYGSARALGGGLVDLGKGLGSLAKGGKLSDIDTRRISYLATTGALTALTGAAVTYMATGKPPQKLRDYIFPPSGAKDRDGHDVRLNTGFYTTDYYDFMHDPVGTLKAKGSPLMHAASDLLTNRDYKGDKVFDTDAPWYKMAGQVASYLGKSATPLSVQQLEEVIQGGGKSGKSPLMQAAGFAGVKTAPRSLSQSDAEIAAHQILQGHESVAGRSVRERETAGLKGKLADELRDKNPDAQKDLRQAVAAGQITGKDTKAIDKRAHEPTGLAGLLTNSSLDARDVMEKVWPKMTPEERRANQWMIRGKIGRANLSPAEKQTFWKQISSDVRGK